MSQLQERLTERTSGTDRKRRQAPVGPPTRMPGGTKDTVMMTVSIVMPADRVCVRSRSNMSTCGIRERLTPRDTEQTQNDSQCISSGLVVPSISNQTTPMMPDTPARRGVAADGAAANIQPLAAQGGLQERLPERAREKAGRR